MHQCHARLPRHLLNKKNSPRFFSLVCRSSPWMCRSKSSTYGRMLVSLQSTNRAFVS